MLGGRYGEVSKAQPTFSIKFLFRSGLHLPTIPQELRFKRLVAQPGDGWLLRLLCLVGLSSQLGNALSFQTRLLFCHINICIGLGRMWG